MHFLKPKYHCMLLTLTAARKRRRRGGVNRLRQSGEIRANYATATEVTSSGACRNYESLSFVDQSLRQTDIAALYRIRAVSTHCRH